MLSYTKTDAYSHAHRHTNKKKNIWDWITEINVDKLFLKINSVFL